MIRCAIAVSILLVCTALSVSGQSTAAPVTELAVNVTADVYKSATTASEVIGKAPRGTVLPINRNLGSWVEVPWPGGPAGIAFVHVSTGTITARSMAPASNGAHAPTNGVQASTNGAQAAIAQIAAVAAAANSAGRYESATIDRVMAANRVAARPMDYVSLPQHQIGIGALLNTPTLRFGGSARTWWGRRFGVAFSFSRPAIESADGQLIPATQLAPSVLYSLPGGVTDSVWVRPYIGAGPRFYRANLDTGVGYEALGGVETTIAAMPQFALSGEIGYRWSRPSVSDFMPRKIAFSLSGHWYVR